MGVDIDGCVEVRKVVSHGFPLEWVGVALIEERVERNYGMFGILLDVRARDGIPTPFAHRGHPRDISGEGSFQASLLGAGMVNPSWMLWSEIESIREQVDSLDALAGWHGWQACFDIMAALAKNYGGDNARLVAWCDMK